MHKVLGFYGVLSGPMVWFDRVFSAFANLSGLASAFVGFIGFRGLMWLGQGMKAQG